MTTRYTPPTRRRAFLQAAAATALIGSLPFAAFAQTAGTKYKIGIIGSGKVGSAIGGAWIKAGHEVMFSSLDLEADKKLAASLGGKAPASAKPEAKTKPRAKSATGAKTKGAAKAAPAHKPSKAS